MITSSSYVSILINYIVHTYFTDLASVCLVWNDDFQFDYQQFNTENYTAIVSLHYETPTEDGDTPSNPIESLTKFEKILAASIERSHCESFIAFEKDIAGFVDSFMKAIIHSQWHSLNNRFLFVYNKDHLNANSEFTHGFFKDIANILFVEIINETLFDLKTTKYAGSRKDHPEQIIFLDRYHGGTSAFEFNRNLYPDKVRDLMGREVISAAFPYEPFTVLKNDTAGNVMDVSDGNEDPTKRLLYDGTDAQFLFQLCLLYNCTVQVDSSEKKEWGFVYENFTADGTVGMVLERKADVAMMGMYMWFDKYAVLDMSSPISRSGVTCLVPAPRRLTSWLLPLEPFQLNLWIGIYGLLAVEALALFLTRKIEYHGIKENSWLKCFEFGYISSLKLFVSQGTNYAVTSTSVRAILFSCYIIDIIITSVYSGGLASILTVPSLEEPADTVDRIIKQQLIWVGSSVAWLFALQDTQEEKMLQIINLFRVLSVEEIRGKSLTELMGVALERLQFGHFAIPTHIGKDTINQMKLMTEDIYFSHCVVFTQRSWPLLEKFNNFCIMVQSSGLLEYWEREVVAKHLDESLHRRILASAHTNFDEAGPVPLGLNNFAGIGLLWICGILLSFLVLIFELVFHKWKKNE